MRKRTNDFKRFQSLAHMPPKTHKKPSNRIVDMDIDTAAEIMSNGGNSDDALYGMHMGITQDRYRSAPSQYASDMSGAEVMGESRFLGEQFSGGMSPNMFYDILKGLVDTEDNSVDPDTGIRSKGLGFYGGLPVDMDGDGEIDHILTKDGLKPTGQSTPVYGLTRNVDPDTGVADADNPLEIKY
tara:strand:- start:2539 stop:3090 length:552 start_codon:yes stop_codon:yes gene_type:complete